MNDVAIVSNDQLQDEKIVVFPDLSLWTDDGKAARVSDIIMALCQQETNYGSWFLDINKKKGATIMLNQTIASLYGLIRDTLKYPVYSGLSLFLSYDSHSKEEILYEVKDNNIPNMTLADLFIKLYDKTGSKEIAFKAVRRFIK